MSDYIPNTAVIRHGYIADIMAAIDMTNKEHRKFSEEEFDRWLIAHDEEIKQQAFKEASKMFCKFMPSCPTFEKWDDSL